MSSSTAHAQMLAVDLGLRTGLAWYHPKEGLLAYRSQNYGAPVRLKKGAHVLLAELPQLEVLVIEGGGELADIWIKAAEGRGIEIEQIRAEFWRESVLYARLRRTGPDAKKHADTMARKVIAASPNAPNPTSLRHDAAEAVLIGWWAARKRGWWTPDL